MRVIYFRNNHRIFNALTSISAANALPLGGFLCGYKESQMPKLKTKSGAKKRFKVTATGKVMLPEPSPRVASSFPSRVRRIPISPRA